MVSPDIPLTETMFYILLVLHQPLHGYGITQAVAGLTGGRVSLGAGTLYGALKVMNERDWIELRGPASGPRNKKEYVITEKGREVYAREVERLREALRNAEELED